MADLEFVLPLPPGSEFRQKSYLNSCRDRAWGAVSELPVLDHKYWPTREKVRCDILFYTKEKVDNANDFLLPVINAIGGVLWDKRTCVPLVMIQQIVNGEKEQIVFRITRRKLVSEGSTRHYEW